jgi:hemolysin D
LSKPPAPPDLSEVLESTPPGRDRDDFAFLPMAVAMVETPPSRGTLAFAIVLPVLVVGLLALSLVTHVSIYAQAPGEVVAVGGTKVIESQAQGVVAKLPVHDGQHVSAGQTVVELDPTDALAQRTLIAGKLADAQGVAIRLRAEIAAVAAGTLDPMPPIPWTDAIPAAVREREAGVMQADLRRLAATYADLDARRRTDEAARDGYAASIARQTTLIATLGENVDMHAKLTGLGVESQAKLLLDTLGLRHQQVAMADLKTKYAGAVSDIVTIEAQRIAARANVLDDDQQSLAATERMADDLAQHLVRADSTLHEMTLTAPVAGTVTASAVTTIGQVALPGQQLMQIVPDDATLQIEAYVLNTDVGYVRTGQPVTIKVDTFPYTRYGVLHGSVSWVSADAIPGAQALLEQKNEATAVAGGTLSDTAAAQHTGDLVFPVTVAPTKTSIAVEGRETPLLPGMSVVVEIQTERQSAIAWVLYPLARGLIPIK